MNYFLFFYNRKHPFDSKITFGYYDSAKLKSYETWHFVDIINYDGDSSVSNSDQWILQLSGVHLSASPYLNYDILSEAPTTIQYRSCDDNRVVSCKAVIASSTFGLGISSDLYSILSKALQTYTLCTATHNKIIITTLTIIIIEIKSVIIVNPLREHVIIPVSDIKIYGINDSEYASCNRKGSFLNIDDINYVPTIIANVLSYAMLAELFNIQYDHENQQFIVSNVNNSFVFQRNNNRYIMHYQLPTTNNSINMISRYYTKRDVERANKALTMIKILGYPGTSSVIRNIRYNAIGNCDINAADVNRAIELYGNQIPSIRGMTTKPRNSITNETIKDINYNTNFGVHLYIDIMYVKNTMMLICTDHPLCLTMASHIVSKNQDTILIEVNRFITEYQIRGFTLLSINWDAEKVFVRVSNIVKDVKNIPVYVMTPGRHTSIVERMIRTIKSRARSIVQSLKYDLPMSLVPNLIKYSAQMINLMLRSDDIDRTCPMEKFLNEKPKMDTYLRIAFGSVGEVEASTSVKMNTLNSRTEPAISLELVNNGQGDYNFLLLTSNQIATRSIFREVNINDEIKRMIEKLDPITTPALSLEDFMLNNHVDDVDEDDETEDDQPRGVGLVDYVSREYSVDEDTAASDQNESEDVNFRYGWGDTSDDSLECFDRDYDEGGVSMNSQLATDDVIDSQLFITSAVKQVKRSIAREALMNETNIEVTGNEIPKGDEYLDELAIRNELQSMYDKCVWVEIPSNATITSKILPSKLFLKDKMDTKGNFTKVKARLVVCGNYQEEFADYENYSPTAGIENIMLTLLIGWQKGMKVTAIDVSNAYLNVDSTEDVYMSLRKDYVKSIQTFRDIDPCCIKGNGTMIVKIKKALYGMKSSAKLWYLKLRDVLNRIGLIENDYDPSVFIGVINNCLTYVIVYVDDLIIMSEDRRSHEVVQETFKANFEKFTISCKFNDRAFEYLQMKITLLDGGRINFDMTNYINKLVNDGTDERSTKPYDHNLFQVNEQESLLPLAMQNEIRSEVAKLLYVAKRNRYDILLPISYLTTRVNKYTRSDYDKMKKITKYLRATKDKTLTIGGYDTLRCYADASHGILNDGKSIGAYGFTFGVGMFGVSVSKLKCVARSSCEAELITADKAVIQIAYIRRFASQLDVQLCPTRLYQDCSSAIKLAQSSKPNNLRYLNIRKSVIKEMEQHKEIIISKVHTSRMVVDFITKPTLPNDTFTVQRDMCMGELTMNYDPESEGACREL